MTLECIHPACLETEVKNKLVAVYNWLIWPISSSKWNLPNSLSEHPYKPTTNTTRLLEQVHP